MRLRHGFAKGGEIDVPDDRVDRYLEAGYVKVAGDSSPKKKSSSTPKKSARKSEG